MQIVPKISHAAKPATLADCRQIGDQIRASLDSMAPALNREAARLLGVLSLMERRAEMLPQDVPSYSAARGAEAAALASQIASEKAQRDHIAQTFQRLVQERAQPRERLESAATTSAATIATLTAEQAKAKQAKADAQAAHIADGNDGTPDTRRMDAEVRRCADALDEERERLAAIQGRLQAIGAEIAQADADASARAKEIGQRIESLERAAQELTIDTAAGLYVLTLAHGLRNGYQVPKFELKIHGAGRVPFVSGRTYELTDGYVKDFLRAQSAPTADEWLDDVRAAGLEVSFSQDTPGIIGRVRARLSNPASAR